MPNRSLRPFAMMSKARDEGCQRLHLRLCEPFAHGIHEPVVGTITRLELLQLLQEIGGMLSGQAGETRVAQPIRTMASGAGRNARFRVPILVQLAAHRRQPVGRAPRRRRFLTGEITRQRRHVSIPQLAGNGLHDLAMPLALGEVPQLLPQVARILPRQPWKLAVRAIAVATMTSCAYTSDNFLRVGKHRDSQRGASGEKTAGQQASHPLRLQVPEHKLARHVTRLLPGQSGAETACYTSQAASPRRGRKAFLNHPHPTQQE